MKKILSILGAITLIGTSSTNLVACNEQQYTAEQLKELKEKNKIRTNNKEIRDNLEWIARQENPFWKTDNKWYYFIASENKYFNFGITKIKNIFSIKEKGLDILKKITWNPKIINFAEKYRYFKSVYRWNLDTPEPDLIVDDFGNIKVNGE